MTPSRLVPSAPCSDYLSLFWWWLSPPLAPLSSVLKLYGLQYLSFCFGGLALSFVLLDSVNSQGLSYLCFCFVLMLCSQGFLAHSLVTIVSQYFYFCFFLDEIDLSCRQCDVSITACSLSLTTALCLSPCTHLYHASFPFGFHASSFIAFLLICFCFCAGRS